MSGVLSEVTTCSCAITNAQDFQLDVLTSDIGASTIPSCHLWLQDKITLCQYESHLLAYVMDLSYLRLAAETLDVK